MSGSEIMSKSSGRGGRPITSVACAAAGGKAFGRPIGHHLQNIGDPLQQTVTGFAKLYLELLADNVKFDGVDVESLTVVSVNVESGNGDVASACWRYEKIEVLRSSTGICARPTYD
jgi:hypothetical protein